jgi:hypothetical protein
MNKKEALSLLQVGGSESEWNQRRGLGEEIPDLRGAFLSDCFLKTVNLRDANLQDSVFIDAYLVEADLRGANLANACLRGADLSHADLKGAILREADLTGVNFYRADLLGCDFQGANLTRTNFNEAKSFRRAVWQRNNATRSLDRWGAGPNACQDSAGKAPLGAELSHPEASMNASLQAVESRLDVQTPLKRN